MSPETQGVGEPWKLELVPEDNEGLEGGAIIRDSDGYQLMDGSAAYSERGLDEKESKRAVACVNALAGCLDPEKFIADIRKALKDAEVDLRGDPRFARVPKISFNLQHPNVNWLEGDA